MAARRGAPLALMCTYEAKKNELNVFANARGGAAETTHCRFISWADKSCFSLKPIRDSRMPCMQRAGKEACQSLSTGTRRRQLLPFLPRLACTKPPRTAPPPRPRTRGQEEDELKPRGETRRFQGPTDTVAARMWRDTRRRGVCHQNFHTSTKRCLPRSHEGLSGTRGIGVLPLRAHREGAAAYR